MIDLRYLRLQYVQRILRTMDSQFEMDGESEIWVDDRQWHIYLSEDDPSQVVLQFQCSMENSYAAHLALRFSGIAGLLGLEVCAAPDFPPDSTNLVAGLITSVNKN